MVLSEAVALPAAFIMGELVIPQCRQVDITLGADVDALIKMGIGPTKRA